MNGDERRSKGDFFRRSPLLCATVAPTTPSLFGEYGGLVFGNSAASAVERRRARSAPRTQSGGEFDWGGTSVKL